MSHLNLIAILEPLPGKADRVVEILSEIAKSVEANEHTTIRYEINRHVDEESKVEEIIMIEAYKDKAAIELHMKSEAFLAGGKKLREENLIGKPMVLKVATPVGGFASRL